MRAPAHACEVRPANPGLERPEAVLFDWDNTLADNWRSIYASLNATLETMGQPPWGLEEAERRLGPSSRESFPAIFGDLWKEAENLFYGHFGSHHLEFLKPSPGAAGMLTALGEWGIQLGVVSSKSGRYLRREVAHLGWEGFFAPGAVIGSGDAAGDKPSAAPVRLALERAGVEKGAWVAGDGPIDFECARNAGCFFVLLREEGPRRGEFGADLPDLHVKNCRDFGEFVRGL